MLPSLGNREVMKRAFLQAKASCNTREASHCPKVYQVEAEERKCWNT